MSSLVLELQRDVHRSARSVTESLRTAKLISAKLGLNDITEWIKMELEGYRTNRFPAYRFIRGGTLQMFNPYHGWLHVGHYSEPVPTGQPVSELEKFAAQRQVAIKLPERVPVTSLAESMDYMVNQFDQQLVISGTQVQSIVEAVREKLLDWSIELEQRGILGENMSFNPEEKQSAQTQNFHIQQFTGVLGNVSNSSVGVYNYSSLHQNLKDAGVIKAQRDELEEIMDELKDADPSKKRALLEKAKNWYVRNKDVLGATASIVRQALGFGEVA